MRAEESRPGVETEAAKVNQQGDGSTANSLPECPDISTMTPRAQHISMRLWESGYSWGYRAGYDAARAEQDALDAKCAGLGTMLSKSPSYAELAERRGQHDRAEQQRRTLADRGIA